MQHLTGLKQDTFEKLNTVLYISIYIICFLSQVTMKVPEKNS